MLQVYSLAIVVWELAGLSDRTLILFCQSFTSGIIPRDITVIPLHTHTLLHTRTSTTCSFLDVWASSVSCSINDIEQPIMLDYTSLNVQ